jgi:Domain of unknown function (DUF3418)
VADRDDPAVREVRWMIEELRSSLFADTVGTPAPVSVKAHLLAMDALDARVGWLARARGDSKPAAAPGHELPTRTGVGRAL